MSEVTDIKLEKSDKLSASKIKTFEDCSWLFYVNYILRLPKFDRAYFVRGTIVHAVLEFLLKDRHKHYFHIIKKAKSVYAAKSIDRYVKISCKKHKLTNIEEYDLICSMIVAGLEDDFYCDGADKLSCEEEFDIKTSDFWIGGFIDKKVVYGETTTVYDYKTSKSKFDAKQLEWNIQALMYTLAVWMQTGVIPKIVFKFLRFPGNTTLEMPLYTEAELRGFQDYIRYITKEVRSFDLQKAQTNFAADTEKRWLSCGRCNNKEEFLGDFSKHCCVFKFDFYYYELFDENGKSKAKSMLKSELCPGPNDVIKKKYYKGCPAFRKNNNG